MTPKSESRLPTANPKKGRPMLSRHRFHPSDLNHRECAICGRREQAHTKDTDVPSD